MALLKVLLLLGLGVSVNSDVSLQKRIIRGDNCDDTERLYHVRIESTKDYIKYHCGGSLIHPEWILTAAQCWQSEADWTNVAMLKVHPRTAGQQRQEIQQAPVIYANQHEIMLVKLHTPVTDVPPARLPDCRNRLRRSYVVQLAGEGGTTIGPDYSRKSGAPFPAHLQCVNMKVVQPNLFSLTHGHIFHASARSKDICFGDAGGAAVHNSMIYGVILYGGQDFACQSPVAILDVCEYLDWIKQTTGLQ